MISTKPGALPFHVGPFKTIADVEYATAGWVDWYNNRRLHTLIGDIPPAEFEVNYYTATPDTPTGDVTHMKPARKT